jgi:hypothetical protein
MVGEDQFGHGLPGTDDAGGIGVHHHTLHTLGGAGRGQVAAAFHLHHADPARGRQATIRDACS